MAYQKAITGNTEKKNFSTMQFVGAKAETNGANITSIQPGENTTNGAYGSVVATSVGVASSGNLGVSRVVDGTVNKLGEFMIRGVADTVAGASDTTLKSGSSDVGVGRYPRPIEFARRLDEDSWNAKTGAVTKGGAQGAQYLYHGSTSHALSGVDEAARPTYAIPGEFTAMEGKALPTMKDYDAKYSS